MTRPIDSCAVCVAGGKNLNPVHFMSDWEADATVAGLTVHSRHCSNDAAGWVRDWDAGKAEFKDGAWRWKSSGNVPPTEIVNFWAAAGFITAEAAVASLRVSRMESDAALERYREWRNKTPYDAEEIAEMRAAFGEGEEVVDILTGKRIKL